jgi:hypothetical protein
MGEVAGCCERAERVTRRKLSTSKTNPNALRNFLMRNLNDAPQPYDNDLNDPKLNPVQPSYMYIFSERARIFPGRVEKVFRSESVNWHPKKEEAALAWPQLLPLCLP